MDALTISAASGLRARMESLDLLANNLANAATGGFKSDREFYGLYSSAAAEAGDSGLATVPAIEKRWTDFSQGTLRKTGNSLDLALSGKGFFAVQGPSGPLYTRNGSLRISPAGALTSSDGYPVRLAGGGRLQVSSGTSLEIQTDGTIRQDGSILGRLDLVDFAEPNSLAKVGNNYFRATDSGAPTLATATSVEQGALEDSNVGTAESAIRIVGVMRQFEMLQKAVSIGAEMNRKAVEEVARVGA
jgi:flagellar basal-body rod protein FlgF